MKTPTQNAILQKIIPHKMIEEWNQFWFGPIDLYNTGLFRCIFGFAILIMYLIRDLEFKYYYTEGGLVPVKLALEIIPDGYRPFIGYFFHNDAGIYFQGVLHIVLIVLFALGVYGRSLTWLLFFVNLGFNQRNMSVIYGADLFASFWLFYLSFVQHNQYFSVLNLFNKQRPKIISADLISTMGVRLLQIQLCICYAYTGIEKLKGSEWWDGSALWYVIGMEEMIPHDLGFMKHFSFLLGAASMATIIFEIYFIFAVWTRRLRYPWLIVGLLFHLGTALFLGLWFFCIILVSTYLLFLTKRLRWPQRLRLGSGILTDP